MSALVLFLISAMIVIIAGMRLTRDGDAIAERTGLGGAWIGATLLAGATSLPELSTGVFAVHSGNVSMAVAEVFGSNMANMLILAVADLAVMRKHILTRIAVNQTLVGALAITLTALAAAGIVTGEALVVGPLGWAPVLVTIGYLAGMRLLQVNRAEPPFDPVIAATAAPPQEELPSANAGLRRLIVSFGVSVAVVLLAANVLADASAALSDAYGLTQSFVGATLLALTTSLPEVTVTVASIRRGAYDLAVGNLLGSNCFNMTILLALDIVDREGSVLTRAGTPVLVSALFAIVLMAQTLIEVLNRTERRIFLLEPDAVLRIGVYLVGLVLIYQIGG